MKNSTITGWRGFGEGVVEYGKICGGGLALDAVQGVEVCGAGGGGDAGGEEIGGAGEGVGAFRGRVLCIQSGLEP